MPGAAERGSELSEQIEAFAARLRRGGERPRSEDTARQTLSLLRKIVGHGRWSRAGEGRAAVGGRSAFPGRVRLPQRRERGGGGSRGRAVVPRLRLSGADRSAWPGQIRCGAAGAVARGSCGLASSDQRIPSGCPAAAEPFPACYGEGRHYLRSCPVPALLFPQRRQSEHGPFQQYVVSSFKGKTKCTDEVFPKSVL